MLEHGGRLRAAAKQYNIPVDAWLDLSAAINPSPYPVTAVPVSVWQRLPEDEDGLCAAAEQYYRTSQLLPVAGSQAAIQVLPNLFTQWLLAPLRIGILSPTYNEHCHAWQKAGHHIVELSSRTIENNLDTIDVLLLVNPNNPTGESFDAATLQRWHQQLSQRGKWLIIDEAFIDATPENSLLACAGQPGLIVLRSLGKFFGLAGARVGFVFAENELLAAMSEMLGPWPISHPSRYVATAALLDVEWQCRQRRLLLQQSGRLAALLAEYGFYPAGGSALFQWIPCQHADAVYDFLARQGILVRHYAASSSLRFGIPASENDWCRLADALENVTRQRVLSV